ncbi:caspase domain-containing protein [Mycena pura]|uniref:Caspase domain-containing protein n=1 Tax=Mycena pura TaxID=153505 RepID=A0AAD6UQ66_9AGAR|nr:caspase domain-containing protein [Mycena pura]
MKIGRYHPTPHSRRTAKHPQSPQVAQLPEKTQKKALLIGISYNDAGGAGEGFAPLVGPHADVASMRKLLISRYGYKEADIVTLLDAGDGVQPTRVNILRAIDDLVGGARKGDRFFFHYCGHTMQVENRSNSEEDGMDECLVPVDGESNKIVDNELRRHLVNALPVGSSLVAVFDSCHSASLLDLAHFRCNRVYVPWISKGRRRSDERWNAVVRRLALPFSKPPTPASSPPVSRAHTRADLSAAPVTRSPLMPLEETSAEAGAGDAMPTAKLTTGDDRPKPARRPTRQPTRQQRQPIGSLDAEASTSALAPAMTVQDETLVPTRPNSPSPLSPDHMTPVVTTRRIYEAARTSPGRVRAWCTEVDALELDVDVDGHADGADADGEAGAEPHGLARAGTEGDVTVQKRTLPGATERRDRRGKGQRASLPLVPLRPASLSGLGFGARIRRGREPEGAEPEGRQRRTTVTPAHAVSVAVREHETSAGAEKENAPTPNDRKGKGVRPSLKLAMPKPAPARPKSWFDDDEDRACESPAPVWCTGSECRDPARAHDAERDTADVISLASCKDYQISWEDEDGGSMTRELVRILDQDPHPTLRSLVSNVSHALHRMSLERHFKVQRYKRDLKAWQRYYRDRHPRARTEAPGANTEAGAGSSGTTVAEASVDTHAPSISGSVSRPSTLSPATPSGSFSDAQLQLLGAEFDRKKPRGMAPQPPVQRPKSEGFSTASVMDTHNFQDPQVSSHWPLAMEEKWDM